MSCSHQQKCPLFSQFVLHPALYIWQERYCEANFKRCVRYIKASKGAIVPVTLLPNGKLLSVTKTEEEMRGNILFNAVVKNRSWMLKSLLEKLGADVNYQNSEGTSALMIAAEHGLDQMLMTLLAHGADTTLTNVVGETAAQLAARKGYKELSAVLNGWSRTPVTKSRQTMHQVPQSQFATSQQR